MRDVRMLIAVRVVVVTTLLLAALLIQFTVNLVLPIDYLYLTTALTYGLTFIYIGSAKMFESRTANLYLQTCGDIFVETVLVYFTGGIESPFSFLYLVSIITAATLLYRRGGLITASAAVISYGALADLMYYGFIPAPSDSFFTPTEWTPARLYMNLFINTAGFYAAALLTSYVSEQLRKTFEELNANRQNLLELQTLNENIIESIPSGLLTTDLEGTILSLNPAACDILRLTPDVAGRHVVETQLFSHAEWASLNDTLQRVVRGERSDFMVADEVRTLGYAITPLRNAAGETKGLTIIFQDLTEMKKLEAQLRLKDRMAAVGELSAGIAHEIRNPLAAIAGSVQVLRNSKSLSTQEQRLMSIILKESERLNKSIADFLRFVKPQEKMPTEFDIAASLAETLDLLRNSPELADHRIVDSIEPPSFSIFGDADQIRQVFWNIARNAIQAMPSGGAMRVFTTVEDGFYRIMFADSGKGMSEEDQRRLFQPFRTNFPSGTGLGMAISYRIVQEHNGRIEVESRPGEGTVIAVSLPTGARHAAAAS